MSLATETGARERVRKRRRNRSATKPNSIWLRNIELGLLLVGTPLLLAADTALAPALLVALGVGWLWLLQFARTRQPLLPATPLTWPLIVLLATTVVGLLASADPQRAQPFALAMLAGVAWWRFLAHNVADLRGLWAAVALFVLIGLGLATLGVLTTAWNSKVDLLGPAVLPLEQLVARAPAALRQLNAATHPNRLAALLLQMYPLLLVLTLLPLLRAGLRVPAGLIWLGTALLLLLTQSRSGWFAGLLSTLVVLLLVALTARARVARLAGWGSVAALLLAAVVLLAALPRDTLTQLWQEPPRATALGSFQSLGFRQEVWQWALTAIRDFPLTGLGLGSFETAVHRLYPINIPVDYVGLHAHNLYLQLALDFGVIGLMAYLALLVAATLAVWRLPATTPAGVRWVALGAWTNVLALQLYGLSDAIELGSLPSILFWLSLGLLSAAVRLAPRAGAPIPE